MHVINFFVIVQILAQNPKRHFYTLLNALIFVCLINIRIINSIPKPAEFIIHSQIFFCRSHKIEYIKNLRMCHYGSFQRNSIVLNSSYIIQFRKRSNKSFSFLLTCNKNCFTKIIFSDKNFQIF